MEFWKRKPHFAVACAAVGLLCACSTKEESKPPSTDPVVEKAQADPKLSPGEAFLLQNSKREGVVTTASGLQYEVLASGDGASPGPTDTVTAHYHGTLIDGRVFDSSVQRDKPLTIQVHGVIKGWQEALQLMRVGDKWKVVIPPDLAYGEHSPGGAIGPNETLIFEMELLAIGGEAGK